MDNQIDGTSFTIDFIVEKLSESCLNCKIDNLLSFEVKDITNGSAFMSNVFKLIFKWKDERIEPSSVILKIPCTINAEKFRNEAKHENSETIGGVNEFLECGHTKEMHFYEMFPKYDISLKLPTYYYGHEYRRTHSKGIIIMEDLTPHSLTVPMLPGFSHEQICALIDELAHIHCVSWKQSDWIPQLKMESGNLEDYIKLVQQMFMALKHIKPEWFAEQVDQLMPYITTENMMKLGDHTEEKFGFPPCIVHGDLWAPNVLWCKDEHGKATSELCAIIDWQMVRPGNPCEDIARLLNLNVSSEYRRKNTTAILKRYYENIIKHFDGKPSFTFKQLEAAYRVAAAFNIFFTAFGAPVYHEMESVVGKVDDPRRDENRLELLDRVHSSFEDALLEWRALENSSFILSGDH